MPILELLSSDKIMHHIQNITEDAIISYDENRMRIEDKEYINSDYVFMVYEDDENNENSENLFQKKVKHIPLSVIDYQYIKFLETIMF